MMSGIHFFILDYPGALRSNVEGWKELFTLANWLRGEEFFIDGGTENADLLLIPGCLGREGEGTELQKAAIPAKAAATRGALIAAVCAGVEVVLAAGLDKGRSVTTHWSLAASLGLRFPSSRIDASRLVIDHGNLVMAGGVLAWIDLGLHMVGRLASPALARSCACTLVWDPARTRQLPYAPPSAMTSPLHPDPLLEPAVAWAMERLGEGFSAAEWAAAAGLGLRTMERRWILAFGRGPAAWLRIARIALARRLLEEGRMGWEGITQACGYTDSSRFRAAFAHETGWSPAKYARAFGPVRAG
jgi:transcriptional regulator GlxA family with amidase domain